MYCYTIYFDEARLISQHDEAIFFCFVLNEFFLSLENKEENKRFYKNFHFLIVVYL